ncbi:MAG: hypothetical protein HUJ31_09890 [Pseudomonadales bacterium]|nr:hypothetical protein [Pseudomonadales bacterium]
MSHYSPDDAIALAPVAFLIVDCDHNILYANEYARALLECDDETNFKGLLHPASVKAYEALHQKNPEAEEETEAAEPDVDQQEIDSTHIQHVPYTHMTLPTKDIV